MSDLGAFIEARLAEAETLAKCATPGRWHYKPPHDWADSGRDDEDLLLYTDEVGPYDYDGSITPGGGEHGDDGLRRPDLEHIVRHQPRAVIAMVEALRAVVKELEGHEHPALASLARAWASHPDYREEWA